MVIVELTDSRPNHLGKKHYFVGASLEAVLADTQQGSMFGYIRFSNYRQLTEQDAQALGVGLLSFGKDSVLAGRSDSFKLESP